MPPQDQNPEGRHQSQSSEPPPPPTTNPPRKPVRFLQPEPVLSEILLLLPSSSSSPSSPPSATRSNSTAASKPPLPIKNPPPETFMQAQYSSFCYLLRNPGAPTHNFTKSALMLFLKPESLKRYVRKMDEEIRNHLEMHWHGKQKLTVLPLMKNLTFNIICSLLFGVERGPRRDELIECFQQMLEGIWSVPVNFPFTRYNRSLKASKEGSRNAQGTRMPSNVDPSRFENQASVPPYSFVAFGGGSQKNCLFCT